MCSVEASFQLVNYKVDVAMLSAAPTLQFIQTTYIGSNGLAFKVSVRQPQHFKKEDIYVCGLDFIAESLSNKEYAEEEFSLHLGMAGIFRTFGSIPIETLTKIVKYQAPAILSPYLRAAMTTCLAVFGHGGIILPLLNFNKIAEDSLKDTPIKLIDEEVEPTTNP